MGLPHFSVKRPVTIMMIYAAILLMGFISWGKLPQELFPPITYPQLTIITAYENAAPEEIETQITKIIEEAIGTVSRLRRISSISKEGTSIVIAEFLWGTNMDFASLGLREKIDLIKERLPIDAQEPIVKKFNPFDLPIMTLSITGDMPPARLRDIAERYVKDEIEKIEGVASASVVGGIEREISVEVNQDKLQASGVSLLDVSKSIGESNINYPAGTIKEAFTEYLIRTLGEFRDISEISKISVGVDNRDKGEAFPIYGAGKQDFPPQGRENNEEKRLILLSDVAEIKDGFKELTSLSRFNGKANISVLIQKQAQANTIGMVNEVNSALKDIKGRLPKGVGIEVVYDQSGFIKEAITGVTDAAWQGGILAFFVLLFFLKDITSAIIVATTIPLSVFVTLILMFFSGISVNIMSLGGLALGVGMLVDTSIVVIDNIFRHREELKEDIKTAAGNGAGEVSAAIGATVWTTIAVFLPLVFVIGIAGQIFKQLSLTITYSLTASLYVALTIIPVLTVIFKKRVKKTAATEKTKGKFFVLLDNFYGSVLSLCIKWPWFCIGIVFVIFIGSMFLFGDINKEFMTPIDQGQFIIKVDLPTGTVLEVTDNTVKKIEEVLLVMPDVENVSVSIGSTKGKTGAEEIEALDSNQSQIMVNLKKRRMHSSSWVIQDLKQRINRFDLANVKIEYILQESVFKTAFAEAKPVVLEIKGSDLAILKNISNETEKKLNKVEGLYDVQDNIAPPAPETKVNILKDKAAYYQLSVNDIAQTSHIGIKGLSVSMFKEKGKEFDIKVRLREKDRKDIYKLKQLLVHSPLGIEVPLSEVAYFSVGKGPSQIKRLDQERTVLVSASVYKRGLNKVVDDINRILAKMKLPEGYKIVFGGENQQMQESFNSLAFALVFSIVLIYMIMAATFENLWQPFVIMFTLPLSLIGVAWALFITNTSLNVISILGIIILGGIVVDNGIVLIDFVNSARKEGMPLEEALVYGSKVRLRPILMTALTTILGLVPLSLGIGEGSKLQQPMAISIIGGMIVATLFTLGIIPAVYLVTQRFLDRLANKK